MENCSANIARCTCPMIRCITRNFISRPGTSDFRPGRRHTGASESAFAGTSGTLKRRGSLRCAARKSFFIRPPSGGIHLKRKNSAEHSIRHRSEEHTSELQSLRQLVCRLLLEKKNE